MFPGRGYYIFNEWGDFTTIIWSVCSVNKWSLFVHYSITLFTLNYPSLDIFHCFVSINSLCSQPSIVLSTMIVLKTDHGIINLIWHPIYKVIICHSEGEVSQVFSFGDKNRLLYKCINIFTQMSIWWHSFSRSKGLPKQQLQLARAPPTQPTYSTC